MNAKPLTPAATLPTTPSLAEQLRRGERRLAIYDKLIPLMEEELKLKQELLLA